MGHPPTWDHCRQSVRWECVFSVLTSHPSAESAYGWGTRSLWVREEEGSYGWATRHTKFQVNEEWEATGGLPAELSVYGDSRKV